MVNLGVTGLGDLMHRPHRLGRNGDPPPNDGPRLSALRKPPGIHKEKWRNGSPNLQRSTVVPSLNMYIYIYMLYICIYIYMYMYMYMAVSGEGTSSKNLGSGRRFRCSIVWFEPPNFDSIPPKPPAKSLSWFQTSRVGKNYTNILLTYTVETGTIHDSWTHNIWSGGMCASIKT